MTTDTNPTGRAIREAQRRATERLDAVIRERSAMLEQRYRGALAQIRQGLESLADAQGRIPIERLPAAERLINEALGQVDEEVRQVIEAGLAQSAALSVDAWAAAGAAVPAAAIGDDVLTWIRAFTDENGLQLSDRLWRVGQAARQRVTEALQRAVVEGNSAAQAARDLLLRGQPVPADLASKEGQAAIRRIQVLLGDELLTGEGNPWFLAERVMRTELNRAYGETAVRAAAEHPDVVAVRFRLSPRHPRPDICDLHATANLHGLGPGVYPIDNHPWPAHPNTLSYLEPIFIDEITTDDRKGRETLTNFLNGQPGTKQDAILGGKAKGWAWRSGHLDPRQVTTPWHKVRAALQRRGIDIPPEHAR